MSYLLLTGLLSLLGQVVLLRELQVASFGIELVYLIAIGVWMVGTALGAALWSRARNRPVTSRGWLALASGVALLAEVAFLRSSRALFGGVPGAFLSFPQQVVTLLAAVLPVSTLLGLLFQWSARAHVSEGRTLAAAYGIESLGGVGGGLLATILPRWGVQNLSLAASCAALAAAVVTLKRSHPVLRLTGACVLAAALGALVRSGPIDRALTRWNHPSLVDTRDSPYGRVTLTRSDGQVSVFTNDRLAFETQGTTAEEFVHLAAIQRPVVRDVLVLGGGLEGLVGEVLKHGPSRVDVVELDRRSYETVLAQVPEATQRSLASPVVRVHFADPRWFLRTASRYDLMLIAAGEPDSGQTNRFYTREFFEACAARLTADGVLGFRLASAENVWTPLLAGRMVSIHRALGAVFRDRVTLPGPTSLVLASRATLSRDPDALTARFVDRRVGSRLVSGPFIRYLYTNDRRAAIERTLAQGRAPMNTDVRPICYQYAAMLWLAKFVPALGATDLATALSDLPVAFRTGTCLALIVLAGALFLAARRSPHPQRVLLAGAAGLAGMILETVLLLHYQSRNGVLFQDVGLLLTSFMAGLAVGALVFDRIAASGRMRSGVAGWRRLGNALAVALALLGIVVAHRVTLAAVTTLAETSAFLVAGGVLVAAIFSYASQRRVPDQYAVISPLYAADLAGGAAGALAGTLVLIPLAGLAAGAIAVTVLATLVLLLI